MNTNPCEFLKLYKCLISNAPDGYVPFFFPVKGNNKSPASCTISSMAPEVCSVCSGKWVYHDKKRVHVCADCNIRKDSWKAPHARLSFDSAVNFLKTGGNIGFAARTEDPLVIIDVDDYNYHKFLPDTLTEISRKRVGLHGFYWAKDQSAKVNITVEFGEVRACDQYVVISGSFCPTTPEVIDNEPISEDLKKQVKADPLLGCYTVHKEMSPAYITYNEFPEIFKQKVKKIKLQVVKPVLKNQTIAPKGERSALFDLCITDIVSITPGRNVPHPLHPSKNGANFSISNGLSHCWRCKVSINAIQFLCVKAGYLSCEDAGTGHRKSSAGNSAIVGDDGAIFSAWCEAKKCNLIPADDPIPTRAMLYIAKKHGWVTSNHAGVLPPRVYNKVLRILRGSY